MTEAPKYKPLSDEDFQALLKQAHASQHGLIVEVATSKDLDILRRRVWEWNKKLGLPPISCRTSPKNPRGELWLLKVGDHGKEAGTGHEEIHSEVHEGSPRGAGEVLPGSGRIQRDTQGDGGRDTEEETGAVEQGTQQEGDKE